MPRRHVQLVECWTFDGRGGGTCERTLDGVFLDKKKYERLPFVFLKEVFKLTPHEAEKLCLEAKDPTDG